MGKYRYKNSRGFEGSLTIKLSYVYLTLLSREGGCIIISLLATTKGEAWGQLPFIEKDYVMNADWWRHMCFVMSMWLLRQRRG